MTRTRERVERDLHQIADRAQPSTDGWVMVRTRLHHDDHDESEEIVMLQADEKRITRRPRYGFVAAAACVAAVAAVLVIGGNDPATTVADDEGGTNVAPVAPLHESEAIRIDSCRIDDATAVVAGQNTSDRQASYKVDLTVPGVDGARAVSFVNSVRPGERFVHRDEDVRWAGADVCTADVAERGVDRFDDVEHASCEVTAVETDGTVLVEIEATNDHTEPADIAVVAAVMADDIRIGTATAFFDDVDPSAEASTETRASAQAPSEEVACEAVHMRPMPSG